MKNLNNYNYLSNTCHECASILFFANKNFAQDKVIVLQAIKTDYSYFLFADEHLKADFDFTLQCIKYSANIVSFVSKSLINNLQWLKKALKINPGIFRFLCEQNSSVSKNATLCVYASTQVQNIDYIDAGLFKKDEFVSLVIKNNPLAILKVIDKLVNVSKYQIEQLCILAVSFNAYAYKMLPTCITNNKSFVQRALLANIGIKAYLPAHKSLVDIKINKGNK